jgi:hypothetical protein
MRDRTEGLSFAMRAPQSLEPPAEGEEVEAPGVAARRRLAGSLQVVLGGGAAKAGRGDAKWGGVAQRMAAITVRCRCLYACLCCRRCRRCRLYL